MKVPLSWLREFIDIPVPVAELASRLTMAGVEVEGIEQCGSELAEVVVGEIVSVERHPDADRLVVCQVRAGGVDLARVVCGAPNARAGLRVPYAKPGAMLPAGRRIEVAEVRGVVSSGMLCSKAELGLGDEVHGLLELPGDAVPGQPLAVHLGLEDTVLEIAVTPNRGDCLSVLGLAREIAALYDLKLRLPRFRLREQGTVRAASLATVRIDDPSGCSRYAARLIGDLTVGPSPTWLQQRLRAAELRPLNHIVDVTNYVMLELGQPLHAFDYDRLPEKQIVVRRAGGDRVMRSLDGRDRTLESADLLITTGEIPIAIAGVMGGANSEVVQETRQVLLESARFDPATIRRTARRLGLRSEASYRFERGVDVKRVRFALDRAAALIAQLGGGRVAAGVVEAYPAPHVPSVIELRTSRMEFLLGFPVPTAEARSALRRVGARTKARNAKILKVELPSYRHDLEREVDLIEEVIRLLGYERIPTRLPAVEMVAGERSLHSIRESDLRRFMANQGFHELVTWSFASTKANQIFRGIGVPSDRPVRILNPITAEESELRFSLCPGLLDAVRTNANVGEPSVAAFAIGKVFWMSDRPAEGRRMAAILFGTLPTVALGKQRPSVHFLDAKGALENILQRLGVLDRVSWQRPGDGQGLFHPGKAALAIVEGQPVAVVGALHPDLEAELEVAQACCVFELDLERVLEYVPARSILTDLPRFPEVVRDVAVVVGHGFASDRVVKFVRQWNRGLVERVTLFDEYVGPPIPEGRKSLAYSIAYRSADRTLTDDEVNRLHQQLISDLRAALPVELRQ
jgi:phenylalanyl-tRNA synthetase beta chain